MPRSPDKAGCSLRAVPQPLHTNQPASNLLSVLSQTLLGYMSRVCACPRIKRSTQRTPGRAEAMREGKGRTPRPGLASKTLTLAMRALAIREGNPRLPSPWWRSSTNIKCVPLKGAISDLKNELTACAARGEYTIMPCRSWCLPSPWSTGLHTPGRAISDDGCTVGGLPAPMVRALVRVASPLGTAWTPTRPAVAVIFLRGLGRNPVRPSTSSSVTLTVRRTPSRSLMARRR
jgi:hypothetical protein